MWKSAFLSLQYIDKTELHKSGLLSSRGVLSIRFLQITKIQSGLNKVWIRRYIQKFSQSRPAQPPWTHACSNTWEKYFVFDENLAS
jgi:hypothetical protein